MDLSKIVAISGRSGLYKMVAQTKTGAIIESLADKKRIPAFPHDKISSLAEISVFTTGEDLPFKDVLKKIYDRQGGQKAPDAKSEDKALKAFFEETIPDYDKERVYMSDVRKIIAWYNQLQEMDLLDFSGDETPAEEAGAPGPEATE